MCRPLSLCQPPRECHEQVTFVCWLCWILDEYDEWSRASTKLDTVNWCKLSIIRIIERIWKGPVSSSTDQQDRSGWFGSQKAQTGAAPGATMATKTACFSDHGFPRHLERLELDSAVEGSHLSAFGLHIEMNSKNVRFSNDFNRKPVVFKKVNNSQPLFIH